MSVDIVTMSECADFHSVFEVVGSKGDTYHVSYAGGEGGAHCTCPGFKYRQDCKHVNETFKRGCFWHPQWHDAGPAEVRPVEVTPHTVPGEQCPGCGGPVVAVRMAV